MLRAGENIRHVLVEILARGEIRDPMIAGVSITVGEVRMSPDLKHAHVFVSALGEDDARDLAGALNRAARFVRGEVGRAMASKFTPELHFIPDGSYAEAMRMSLMFNDPRVAQDLRPGDDTDGA